jgi:hypothetical protein
MTAKQYPLALEFAIKHPPHAALTVQVHVIITDARGQKVLDAQSHGTFLLAKLPVGYYTVSAAYTGQRLTRTVHVILHRSAHVLFLWAS